VVTKKRAARFLLLLAAGLITLTGCNSPKPQQQPQSATLPSIPALPAPAGKAPGLTTPSGQAPYLSGGSNSRYQAGFYLPVWSGPSSGAAAPDDSTAPASPGYRQPNNPDYGRNYNPSYSRGYDPSYKQNFNRDYGPDYTRNYNPDFNTR
jgi:hypothetical protein